MEARIAYGSAGRSILDQECVPRGQQLLEWQDKVSRSVENYSRKTLERISRPGIQSGSVNISEKRDIIVKSYLRSRRLIDPHNNFVSLVQNPETR
ncbi:hypothetical protein AAES_152476 [Amazona aestiva]|uniref:Uncharacterized protein n=1 Tax=Amazona aestiva TaxID=12930 RepID=A0A0Q3P384_AMAAE|nr:hypothetical protein AAES_152476 [Amazona aestiva]